MPASKPMNTANNSNAGNSHQDCHGTDNYTPATALNMGKHNHASTKAMQQERML